MMLWPRIAAGVVVLIGVLGQARAAEKRPAFDRPMMTERQWSWIIHQQIGIYPGDPEGPPPRWEDGGRTCVLAVKLAPNTLYAAGVESFRHTGFRTADNKIAVPYVWVFKTGKARKPPEF